MVLIEQKKFTKEESQLFYNLQNMVFMDENCNIVINNDSLTQVLRYENELTKVPITNLIFPIANLFFQLQNMELKKKL
jgi:hypothetical protein